MPYAERLPLVTDFGFAIGPGLPLGWLKAYLLSR
jgi:hypothetical protein